jgi:hypothetical protein
MFIPDPTVHKKRDEQKIINFSCSFWFQEQALLENKIKEQR